MKKRISKTCIALCKLKTGDLLMAGDRRVSMSDGTVFKCPNPKITKTWNGFLTGASGDSALCKHVVDLFDPPEFKIKEIDTYLAYIYVPELYNTFKNLPGYMDEHKHLRLSSGEQCSILLGIRDRAYTIDIFSPFEDESKPFNISRMIFDDAPLPYAIGCGAASAMPILIEEYRSKGYNTKQGMAKAMSVAAELNNGCDNSIDYIQTND